MPPNPGLRRGLKKEWGLEARKNLRRLKIRKMNCTPLTAGSGAASLRRRGGVCYGKDVLAGRHGGGWYATWQLQNYVPKREFHLQNHVPKSQN